MSKKVLLFLLLVSVVGILLWFPIRSSANDDMGTARGQVILISKEGKTVEAGVDICVIREKFYSPQKNGELICKDNPKTDKEGRFETSRLLSESWVFIVRKKGYSKAVFKHNIVSSHVQELSPPPWPLCQSGMPRSSQCSPQRTSTVSPGKSNNSAIVNRRSEPGLTLVLYRIDPPEQIEVSRKQQRIIVGTVVNSHQQPLMGADVFISDFPDDPASKGMIVKVQKKTDQQGGFSLEIPEDSEASGVFSVALGSYRPFIAPLNDLKLTTADSANASDKNVITLVREDELNDSEERLVETNEAAKRYVFTPQLMQALPLPGYRTFDSFVLLAPGVLPPPATFTTPGPGVSPGVGTPGQFVVNGLRSRENNFTIDGSDNNDEDVGARRQGFVALAPQSVESIQELQVITALADARFGRNMGGQIDALTKTGDRGLHGTVYGFFNHNRLNARGFFDAVTGKARAKSTLTRTIDGQPVLLDSQPITVTNSAQGENPFQRTQFGLTVGALTRAPKVGRFLFFGSFEQVISRGQEESHFAVPTVAQRGAFGTGETGFLLNATPFRPITGVYPTTIPGDAIFSLYPFPNNPSGIYGVNDYTAVLPANANGTRFSAKVQKRFGQGNADRKFRMRNLLLATKGDILTGRYNFTQERSTIPVTGAALFSSLSPKVRTQNVAFFLNRTIAKNLEDTVRFSFGRTRLTFREVRDPFLSPSTFFPNTPFLLNAPLLLNVTALNPNGTLNPTSYISAASSPGGALLNPLGYSGITTAEQISGPLGQVQIPGFSPLGVDTSYFPQSRANNTFQIADTFANARTRHLFTFGFEVRKSQVNSTQDRNFRPLAVFNGLRTSTPSPNLQIAGPNFAPLPINLLPGTTLAAAGVPTGLFQSLGKVPDSTLGLRFTQLSVFLQDEFRWRPNIRLTYGARYELNTVPDTVGKRLERAFDAAELKTQTDQAVAECIAIRHDLQSCNEIAGALTSAFPADYRVSFGGDKHDIDARVGFAWDLFGQGNTVIRGGFGTYSGQVEGVVLGQSRNAFSDFLPLNFADFSPRATTDSRTFLFNIANPNLRQLSPALNIIVPGTLNVIPNGNPVSLLVNRLTNLSSLAFLSQPILGLDLVLPQKSLKTPYALQYGITIDHQLHSDYLLSLAYIGTRGIKLLRISTPDRGLNRSGFDEIQTTLKVGQLGPAASFPFFQGLILSPQTKVIGKALVIARTFFESSALSNYNSLQLELRKRYRRTFQFATALTYSHSIDDASDYVDTAGAFGLPQDSLQRSEKASSSFDVRWRSITHTVWDLPQFGHASHWLNGWQLAGIVTAQTGQPYTVNSAFDINRDGNLTDRLNRTAGLIQNHSGAGGLLLQLAPGVNPLSLLAPDGVDGAIGRNTFRAPGLFTIDVAITKSLNFADHGRFKLRAEIFNLFNRANYGIPVRILEAPGFGRSTNTVVPARTIQFSAKFQY